MDSLTVDVSSVGLTVDNPSPSAINEVAKRLHNALVQNGCAYIVGHGIHENVIGNMFNKSKNFFENLTIKEKEAAFPLTLRGTAYSRGYMKQGLERLINLTGEADGFVEVRENFDIVDIGPDAVFPDENKNPGIGETMVSFAENIIKVAHRVMKCMAVALGAPDEDFIVNRHKYILRDGAICRLRSIYYPSINESYNPGLVRCGAHCDFSSITMLCQDDRGGLEYMKDGEWVQTPPNPNSILMQIGDMMEAFSNGVYKAPLHRVVIPEDEAVRRTPRQSVALFIHADDDVTIEPIGEAKPILDKYKAHNAKETTLRKFETMYKE